MMMMLATSFILLQLHSQSAVLEHGGFLKGGFGDSACLVYCKALAVLIYRQLFILLNQAFSSCGNQFSF